MSIYKKKKKKSTDALATVAKLLSCHFNHFLQNSTDRCTNNDRTNRTADQYAWTMVCVASEMSLWVYHSLTVGWEYILKW